MSNRVRPSILQTLDAQVASLIAERRGLSDLDSLISTGKPAW